VLWTRQIEVAQLKVQLKKHYNTKNGRKVCCKIILIGALNPLQFNSSQLQLLASANDFCAKQETAIRDRSDDVRMSSIHHRDSFTVAELQVTWV